MTNPRLAVLEFPAPSQIHGPVLIWLVLTWLVLAFASPAGWAQQSGTQIKLDTKDGLKLVCRYYPSAKGESAVPVILLHAWKGQGSELLGLAQFLNSSEAGRHAVVVPDLRGHGSSTFRAGPDGTEIPTGLEAAKIRKPDFQKIVTQDLEAVKRFLLTEHNQRKLNIDMLCVVGTELGALAGIYWTANDWNWPTLAGGRRQGQDVKALVMISPPMGFKGISINPILEHEAIRRRIAVQVLFGKKGKAAATARRIHAALGRESSVATGYDFRSFDTSLQGTALFTEKQLNVDGFIASFIKAQVVDRAAEMPWKPRAAKIDETNETEVE